MLTSGQTLPLVIDKPAAGGRMIARVEGQVVLVAGAIPGEHVTARVERVGRGVAFADVVSIEQPSTDRRSIDSDPRCGGCAYAHIAYARQLEIKGLVIADAFGRIGRLPLAAAVTVAASPEAGYRMRARLHVRGDRIGFFREGTHEVCDARATRQLRDDTHDTLDRLMAGLRSLGLAGMCEVELSENLDASQRVAHLDISEVMSPRALGGLAMSDGLTGLTVSVPDGRRLRTEVVGGDAHVVDALDVQGVAVRLRRHVLAFFQGNRFLLPSLVSHVAAQVGSGGRVIDLYAGTGLFSVAASAGGAETVVAVEGDATSAADLVVNAGGARGSVVPVHEPVETFLTRTHDAPAVVVVDPPRTGMSKEALEGMLRLRTASIVYVSCDVATLARDARRIVDAGYTLASVAAFDLFPNTPHVETVATFHR